jgi:hypothetical protein
MRTFPQGVEGDAAFDPHPENGEFFNVIGPGSEWKIGCICCDFAVHELFLANALVAVVPCEAAADRVLNMFTQGAKRDPDPDPKYAPHVVLVFGACRTHRSRLHELEMLVQEAGHIITPEIVGRVLTGSYDID